MKSFTSLLLIGSACCALGSCSMSSSAPQAQPEVASGDVSQASLPEWTVYKNETHGFQFSYPSTWELNDVDNARNYNFILTLESPERKEAASKLEKEYQEDLAKGIEWKPDTRITLSPEIYIIYYETWTAYDFFNGNKTYDDIEEFISDVRADKYSMIKLIKSLPLASDTAYLLQDTDYIPFYYLLVQRGNFYKIHIDTLSALEQSPMKEIFASFKFLK